MGVVFCSSLVEASVFVSALSVETEALMASGAAELLVSLDSAAVVASEATSSLPDCCVYTTPATAKITAAAAIATVVAVAAAAPVVGPCWADALACFAQIHFPLSGRACDEPFRAAGGPLVLRHWLKSRRVLRVLPAMRLLSTRTQGYA